MRTVAEESGVPLADLYARTLADVKALGPDKASRHYMMSVDGRDNTHTTAAGAERYAVFAMDAIRAAAPWTEDLFK